MVLWSIIHWNSLIDFWPLLSILLAQECLRWIGLLLTFGRIFHSLEWIIEDSIFGLCQYMTFSLNLCKSNGQNQVFSNIFEILITEFYQPLVYDFIYKGWILYLSLNLMLYPFLQWKMLKIHRSGLRYLRLFYQYFVILRIVY